MLVTMLIEVTPNDEYNTEFKNLQCWKKSEHAHLKKSFSDSAAASPENKLRKKTQSIALITVPW